MSKRYIQLEKVQDDSIDSCVICYGHFTYLHAGHLRYLREAAKIRNKILIVLSKGPLGDGSDNDLDERVDLIMSMFGEVKIIYADNKAIKEVIKKVKKNCTLALGVDAIQNIGADELEIRSLLEQKSSELKIIEGTSGRSLEYLQQGTKEIIKKHEHLFRQQCRTSEITSNRIIDILNLQVHPEVLLIGDIIVDEYVATEPLGISAEAPVIVVKEIETRKYLGGAGVIGKHLRSLGAEVALVSVIGNDNEGLYVKEQLRLSGIASELQFDTERPTTYKKRYISDQNKLFRVSRLSQSSISQEIKSKLKETIKKRIKTANIVIISDFQYGVIDKELGEYIINLAHSCGIKVLVDMQCSTQNGRLTKYKGADIIFPTEKEARITTENWDLSLEGLGQKMMELCMCQNCVLKLAEEGLILFQDGSDQRFQLPALSVSAVDVAGAGDSLLSAVGYSLSQGLDIKEAIALGSTVASLCVENLGNEPVSCTLIKERINRVLG